MQSTLGNYTYILNYEGMHKVVIMKALIFFGYKRKTSVQNVTELGNRLRRF